MMNEFTSSDGFDIEKTIKSFKNRLIIANRSQATVKSYISALQQFYNFNKSDLYELEIDQLIDFLPYLKVEKELNWRTMKIYVAGLRYFYKEMGLNPGLAKQIPYPKEKPSLPVCGCLTMTKWSEHGYSG